MTILKEINCNSCGSQQHHTLTNYEEFRIVKCADCGLIYVNPMPFIPQDTFHEISSDFYYTDVQENLEAEKIEHTAKTFEQQVREWSAFLPDSEERWLLDVGCGTGLFVNAAKGAGWHACGCDVDKPLVELGRNRFDVELSHADLHKCHYADEKFDVVNLKYVLEHLPNPFEVLQETYRVLKPGGIVQIIVPNEGGLYNQINIILRRKTVERWGTLTPPHHLHAYTPKTLSLLLSRAGFDVRSTQTASPLRLPYGLFQGKGKQPSTFTKILFNLAEHIGKGSALIAYAQKPTSSIGAFKQAA